MCELTLDTKGCRLTIVAFVSRVKFGHNLMPRFTLHKFMPSFEKLSLAQKGGAVKLILGNQG